MSMINPQNFQVQQKTLSLVKTATTPAAKPPVAAPQNEVSAPQESFVPTLANSLTVAPPPAKSEETQAPTKPLATPRPGSDMALMLEDMEAAKLAGGEIKANANGTLAIFEEPLVPSFQSYEKSSPETAHHSHGHGKSHDALLGGHLGTEMVEQVGHKAHYAGAHGASEIKSQAGHAVSGAKSHAGHAVSEAKSQAGHALGEAKSEGLSELSSEAAKHGAEVAHHLSTGLQVALGASAAASVGLGGVMLYTGGKELAHGIKEKDGEKIAEGVGGLAVGTRSLAAATVMTSMVSGSSAVAQAASVASAALTPLGLVHGAIDIGLGVKDLVKGDKVDGAIKMGFGSAVIAGALATGSALALPLTGVALGILGVKVGRGIYKANQAKKQAAAQSAEPIPTPPPTSEKSTSSVTQGS